MALEVLGLMWVGVQAEDPELVCRWELALGEPRQREEGGTDTGKQRDDGWR